MHEFKLQLNNSNLNSCLLCYPVLYTHPDSSDWQHKSLITQYHCGYLTWSTFKDTLRVLCCYYGRSYCACSTCRVLSKVLELAVTTVVLHYTRPMWPVRRDLDVWFTTEVKGGFHLEVPKKLIHLILPLSLWQIFHNLPQWEYGFQIGRQNLFPSTINLQY